MIEPNPETRDQTEATGHQPAEFDQLFLARVYQMTTVSVMRAASGVIGGMARDRGEYEELMARFLSGYAEYLASVTDGTRSELYDLLAQMLEDEEADAGSAAGEQQAD